MNKPIITSRDSKSSALRKTLFRSFAIGTALLLLALAWWLPTRREKPVAIPAAKPVESAPDPVAPSPSVAAAPVQPPMQPVAAARPSQPTTPVSQDELWNRPAPEAPFADFQRWADAYAKMSPAEKAKSEAQGVALATARKAAMATLIRKDPELALSRAISETARRTMPQSVSELLEERIDSRGDLHVTAASSPVTARPAGSQVVNYTASLKEGKELQAYVYGRREGQPSRADIPLHGIALGGRMALSEWPGRVLEPIELAEARASVTGQPVCPTSKLPTSSTGDETAIKVGNEVEFYCGKRHAQSDLIHAATEESI